MILNFISSQFQLSHVTFSSRTEAYREHISFILFGEINKQFQRLNVILICSDGQIQITI